MAVYFPMGYFIAGFLPQYTFSLSIFRIILPGLAISSSITVVTHNYYKVFDRTTDFFKKSIVALIVSFMFNVAAYLLFRTREAISISSVLALFFWFFYCRNGIKKQCGRTKKDTVYLLLMCIVFYACTAIQTLWLSGIIYVLAYILISFCLFGKDWGNIKKVLTNKNI